tara:strand:- start:656 stop:1468 length:813 start_codon:yes stop_codon:yes gene_type:complete
VISNNLSIGIVGCGAIGRAILQASDQGTLNVKVVGVNSKSEEKAKAYIRTLRNPPSFMSQDELIDQADLIVEAAGSEVVPDLVRNAFHNKKGAMVISVGALIANSELLELARDTNCRLLMPSGAIIGLDGIKSAAVGRIDRVVMESRKAPEALAGAPHVLDSAIDLWSLNEETVIFEGNAREACVGFPANLNVSAAVSFAGIGPDATTVKMIAAPGLQRNCHDIEVEGEFGLMRIHLENIPGENPKTGKLTAMSIIRTIQQEVDPVRLGT